MLDKSTWVESSLEVVLTSPNPSSGGPGVGTCPSLSALTMVAALYLQYLRFSTI
jgi:hypothetical protein